MHLRGKIFGAEEKKVEFRAAGLGQAVSVPLSPRRGVGQCQDWDVLAKPSTHYRQHPMLWKKGRAVPLQHLLKTNSQILSINQLEPQTLHKGKGKDILGGCPHHELSTSRPNEGVFETASMKKNARFPNIPG